VDDSAVEGVSFEGELEAIDTRFSNWLNPSTECSGG
jgi:hypothetical protein